MLGAVLVVRLLAPGIWLGNLGVLQAQQTLFTARATGRLQAEQGEAAITHLNRALLHYPERAQFYAFLGSLYAAQGEHARALAVLEQRVALDGSRALDQYAPFVRWQRQLAGSPPPPPWESTVRLYSQR